MPAATRTGAIDANDVRALGTGYALFIASQLLAERADPGLKIYNRGISGNKVFQLAERWDADCLALKPNVLSILIGVNDLWHTLDGKYKGTVEIYEKDYRALIARTQQALPEVKLVICEPFVLRCGAVNDKWFPDVRRVPGGRPPGGDGFPRDLRAVPGDVRQGGPDGSARLLGRRRRSSDHRRRGPYGADVARRRLACQGVKEIVGRPPVAQLVRRDVRRRTRRAFRYALTGARTNEHRNRLTLDRIGLQTGAAYFCR